MTVLTKDINRVFELGDINELPVLGEELIYQGAAIGCDVATGYAKNLENGDSFAGFAENNCNNSLGQDSEKRVRLRKRGSVLLEIPGITLADINKSVYATNNNSFTLSSTDAVLIGKTSRIEASGLALVEFRVG
jgi:hypothetical protein